jgi:hypothetical protein
MLPAWTPRRVALAVRECGPLESLPRETSGLSFGCSTARAYDRACNEAASVTLDVYGHLMGGADQAAAAAIEGVLR